MRSSPPAHRLSGAMKSLIRYMAQGDGTVVSSSVDEDAMLRMPSLVVREGSCWVLTPEGWQVAHTLTVIRSGLSSQV